MRTRSVVYVLMVEDEPDLLETTTLFLSEQGYHCRGALTLAQAEAEMAIRPPDILILDLTVDGEDALGWLNDRIELPPHTQVIMATARTGTERRITGVEGGADVYLEKPVALEELDAVVRRMEARLYPVLADVWYFNSTAFRLIAPNGAAAHLTESQRIVVDMLVQAQTAGCTREALINALGHDPEYYSQKRLEVLVRRLRQSVQRQVGLPLPLQTVYGWGYALSARFEAVDHRD